MGADHSRHRQRRLHVYLSKEKGDPERSPVDHDQSAYHASANATPFAFLENTGETEMRGANRAVPPD